MEQVIQMAGALLVLAAFIANQRQWLSHEATSYLVMNFVGSGILAVEAALQRNWGFLLLEGVWSLVSGWGLLAKAFATRSP